MDEATVRAMLEQHFTSGDPQRSHEMYRDDAVLEFPQSGERFAGSRELPRVAEQLSGLDGRRVPGDPGRDDFWVVELSISYDGGPASFGVSILEFEEDKIARETIYVAEGWDAPEWRAQWRSAP